MLLEKKQDLELKGALFRKAVSSNWRTKWLLKKKDMENVYSLENSLSILCIHFQGIAPS